MVSTRAGGGGRETSTSAVVGWPTYCGCDSCPPQAGRTTARTAAAKRIAGGIEARWARACVLAALLAPQLGCSAASTMVHSIFPEVPEGRLAVDSVRMVNAGLVDAGTLEGKISTTPTPRFAGVFQGLFYDFQVYDVAAFQRDLARVERYYRGKGFLEVHVRAGRVVHTGKNHVRVEVVVDEGPPTLNRKVTIKGLDGLPGTVTRRVKRAAERALPAGRRFDEVLYKKAQADVLRALTDRGYAYASGQSSAEADLSAHAVDYTFEVKPGLQAVLGPITIQGLDPDGAGPRPQEIGEAPLLRAMDLTPGEPFSTAKLDAATQALLDLEVFSAAHIIPQLSDPPSQTVPLTVELEPTKLRTIRIGGGFEFDAIKTDLHLLLGWENRNFLGDLRDFSAEFKPGVVLYPFRVGNSQLSDYLPEERLTLALEQPGFLEGRTTGFVRPGINVYPLLVEPNPDNTQPVVGYVEPKGAIGLRRTFDKFSVSLAENIQGEIPFHYTSQNITQPLPDIILSYPQLITTLDLRDNTTHPHKGIYLTNDLQVAGGPFGGSGTDLRINPEVRGYISLAKGVTLAMRGTLGFLFAKNYGDYVQNHLDPPETVGGPAPQATGLAVDRDIELVYFRGFFSGGPSSDRGYPLRGVAPHGVVPFLNPQTATQQAATNCDPNAPKYDPAFCAVPIGGFTQWEASIETRFEVSGPLGIALFCDAADVASGEASFHFDHLHLSCGAGARYDTPAGPIRLDIGFRIPWLQVLGHMPTHDDKSNTDSFPELPTEGTTPTIGPIPMSLAFGIGESF
jgi:outer membrane protein insertion porin family/translocation and assembly module TamA